MFKVKFDSAQFQRIEAKFKKDIQEVLAQPAVMNEIGEFMVERVRYQARTEKPFSEDASFPDLKTASISNRKYLAKYNQTHDTYEAERANVTITGKFLDSLTYVVTGPGKLVMQYAGMHPGYKTKTGHTKPVKQTDLAKWLAKLGFKVMDRSISTNQTIKARIKSIALRYVRRGLKVKNRLD